MGRKGAGPSGKEKSNQLTQVIRHEKESSFPRFSFRDLLKVKVQIEVTLGAPHRVLVITFTLPFALL